MRNAVLLCLLLSLVAQVSAQTNSLLADDNDHDGVSDTLEQILLTQFQPEFMITSGDCGGKPAEFVPLQPAPTVEAANGTIYGLVSAVWTRDIKLAHRLASEIKAGSVWINTYNGFDSGSPFGGYKQSGFGRDLGAHALEQYTNVKSIWVAL